MKLSAAILACLLPVLAPACELCSIYNSPSPRDQPVSGFLLTISEQYVAFETLQNQGEPVPRTGFFEKAFLDSSITHIVPTYNFTPQIGVSLNAPLIDREF